MEHFSQFIKKWVVEVAGKDVIVTDDFVPVTDKPQVTVFLREFLPTAPTHRHIAAPLEIGMRYVVSSASANSTTDANELLQKLAFSAMEHEGLDIDLSPPPPEFWLSLGIKARPCFSLSTKQRKERKLEPVPLVTEPTEINAAISKTFYGTLKSSSY